MRTCLCSSTRFRKVSGCVWLTCGCQQFRNYLRRHTTSFVTITICASMLTLPLSSSHDDDKYYGGSTNGCWPVGWPEVNSQCPPLVALPMHFSVKSYAEPHSTFLAS